MKKVIILILFAVHNYCNGAITICYKSSQGSTVCEKSVVDLKCDDPYLLNLLGAALPQGWTCTESRLMANNPNVYIKYNKLRIAVVDNNGEIIPIASDAFNLFIKKNLKLLQEKKLTIEQFQKEMREFKKRDNGVASLKWINSLAKELNVKVIKTTTMAKSTITTTTKITSNVEQARLKLIRSLIINDSIPNPALFQVIKNKKIKQIPQKVSIEGIIFKVLIIDSRNVQYSFKGNLNQLINAFVVPKDSILSKQSCTGGQPCPCPSEQICNGLKVSCVCWSVGGTTRCMHKYLCIERTTFSMVADTEMLTLKIKP